MRFLRKKGFETLWRSGLGSVPFATSGGSGLGKTLEMLKPSVSGTTVWKEGKLLNGRPSEDSLSQWVAELDL